jgi:hypothetical protein
MTDEQRMALGYLGRVTETGRSGLDTTVLLRSARTPDANGPGRCVSVTPVTP